MVTLTNQLDRIRALRVPLRPATLGAVLATLLATGCAQVPQRASTAEGAKPAASPWALPTATMRWNEYACDLIARNQIGQLPASRVLAYVNLAINNGIVLARQQGRKPDGAAAGAAAEALAYLFPKDEPAIRARLAGEIAAMGNTLRPDFAAASTRRPRPTWWRAPRPTARTWPGRDPCRPGPTSGPAARSPRARRSGRGWARCGHSF